MDSREKKKTEDALTTVIGTILMVTLVVILAAIIAAFLMGLGTRVDNPTFSAFSFEPYYNATIGKTTAFSLYLMAGDTVEGQAGSSQTGGGKKFENAQIVLTDPGRNNNIVSVCSEISGSVVLNPGTQYYVVKRDQPNYYLVNNLSQSNCGGGSGGGNPPNQELMRGTWRVTISDLISGTVIYETELII